MQQSGLASNALTCTPCICERWLNRQQLDSQKQDETTRPHRTPHTRPAVCKSAIQLQVCNQVHWLRYLGKAQWSPHGMLIAWHTQCNTQTPRKTRCSALYNDMILKITMHKMHTAQMSNIFFRCLRHKRQTYNVYILWASLDIFGPQSYTSRSSKLLMAPMTHGTCKLVDLSQLPKWITLACLFRKSSAWQKENRT